MTPQLYAECHLNKAIAEKVKQHLQAKPKTKHTIKLNRDRIAQIILEKLQPNPYAIAFIDYEKGANRAYIKKQLEDRLEHKAEIPIQGGSRIIVGLLPEKKIIVVIFDPRPEEILQALHEPKLTRKHLEQLKNRESPTNPRQALQRKPQAKGNHNYHSSPRRQDSATAQDSNKLGLTMTLKESPQSRNTMT